MPHLTPDLLSYELEERRVMERLKVLYNAAQCLAEARKQWANLSADMVSGSEVWAFTNWRDLVRALVLGRDQLRKREPEPTRFPDRLE